MKIVIDGYVRYLDFDVRGCMWLSWWWGWGLGMRRLRFGLGCGHFESSEKAVVFYGGVLAGVCVIDSESACFLGKGSAVCGGDEGMYKGRTVDSHAHILSLRCVVTGPGLDETR